MSSKASAAKVSQQALTLLAAFFREDSSTAEINRSRLYYLKRHGYLMKSEDGYTPSHKGKLFLSKPKVPNVTISKSEVWDKKWRFVMFDIPRSRKKQRDVFRKCLKRLGLRLYQHSVWIYPHPLEQEISEIVKFYGLHRYVSFAIADAISDEKRLRKLYGI